MTSDLLLGIDTGGTYTDGVLLDARTHQVLKTTKTLTTHHDLIACILRALDDLLPKERQRLQLIGISTTLATNAICEGKGRPVGLFLLGYDLDLVRRFNFDSRFAASRVGYIQGGHDILGNEQAPLDLDGLSTKALAWKDEVEAFAVSGYFSPFNASHEERAYTAITELTGMPVVLGHQLSTRLDSVQRATTASLNGALLSILDDFIRAIQKALEFRGVTAPLLVMRGDGALMGARTLSGRPIETIHSGPAASVIGGRFLAGQERALVIDIGGTTTDIAVLDRGRVPVREDGTTVGPYQTGVRAANIRSVGLGGDSFIGFDVEDRLRLGPNRVIPIAYLAHQNPRVAQDLLRLENRRRHTLELVEYWFLNREPRRMLSNDRSREVVELLREGPMALPDLLERTGVFHPLQFDGPTLVKEEITGRAALTPTDLLHLTGEYSPWNADAAHRAASLVARLRGWPVDELIRRVKQQIAERIVEEVVAFIAGQKLERMPADMPVRDLGVWLFEESLYQKNPYLGNRFSLKIPIIGIGAPAHIFLPAVAELLQTDLILPPNYQVANAVGAVVGSVMVNREAWLIPQMRAQHITGYYVQDGGPRQRFPNLQKALEYAKQAIGEQAIVEARQAGAVDPVLEFEEIPDGADIYRLRACAFGNPALG